MTHVGSTENLTVYRHEGGDFRVESQSPGPYVEGLCWIHVSRDEAGELAARLREMIEPPNNVSEPPNDTSWSEHPWSAMRFKRHGNECWIQLDEWGRGDTWRIDRRGTVQFRWGEAKELSLLLENDGAQ